MIDSDEERDGTITYRGENCPPTSPVTYEVRDDSDVLVDSGTVQTDRDGRFVFTTKPLPEGEYHVTVECGTRTVVLDDEVTRGEPLAADGVRRGALPLTGDGTSVPMARIAVLLLAAGGLALYGGKKRQGRRARFIVSESSTRSGALDDEI